MRERITVLLPLLTLVLIIGVISCDQPEGTTTSTPTKTPTSAATSSPTATPTQTVTPEPTATATFTPVPTASMTATPAQTQTSTPVVTPTSTPGATPTSTPTTLFLALTAPEDEAIVSTAVIQVSGRTIGNAVVTIFANNQIEVAEVDNNGYFESDVTLTEGLNTIEVVASDWYGNEQSRTLTVIYYP